VPRETRTEEEKEVELTPLGRDELELGIGLHLLDDVAAKARFFPIVTGRVAAAMADRLFPRSVVATLTTDPAWAHVHANEGLAAHDAVNVLQEVVD